MAAAAQRTTPERTPAPISPALVAIQRLAKMAAAAAPAPRMVSALDDILVRWGGEELDPDDLRERVETLQSDLDAGAQAAEDYVAEADTDKARALAMAQLDGLAAVRDRLAAIIAG